MTGKYRKPKVIIITGPTASGKSDLAVDLAIRFDGEIVSADSRQVYRGLNLGSGKITKSEQRGIKHHLLDVASPKRVFTASQFQTKARLAVADILSRGKLPIITGGTGFYIDTILFDTVFPPVKPDAKLRQKLASQSTAKLFAKLQKLDPNRAKTIDPHNKVRLIRAIEVAKTLGQVPTTTGQLNPKYHFLLLGIKSDPDQLKTKIKSRLNQRIRKGMVAEVKKLRESGVSWTRLHNLGLEYRYVSLYLKGGIDKKQMIELLNTEIWRYAKRQLTWLKRYHNLHWIKNSQEAQLVVQKFLKD